MVHKTNVVVAQVAAVHEHLLQVPRTRHAVLDGGGDNIFAIRKLVPGIIQQQMSAPTEPNEMKKMCKLSNSLLLDSASDQNAAVMSKFSHVARLEHSPPVTNHYDFISFSSIAEVTDHDIRPFHADFALSA
jgi:hypothetical protein